MSYGRRDFCSASRTSLRRKVASSKRFTLKNGAVALGSRLFTSTLRFGGLRSQCKMKYRLAFS